MKSNKILLNIEQPPPVHGMTYINKIIYDNFKEEDNYCFYDTNFTLDVVEVGNVSFKKVFKNLSIVWGTWKKFFKVKPDVIYSILSASLFGIVRDLMINFMAIVFHKKLVLHLHGFTYYKIYKQNKIYRFIFNIISKNATIIVLCEKQKKLTKDIMYRDSVVLYNCLENEVCTEKTKNATLKLCFISNISKSKGAIDLVKAVIKMDKNLKLVIAGNFLDDKEEFLELIKNEENIKYIGFANEEIKNDILSSSDIFCLPSRLEEGSPVSIIEAMSYGLPVLSTDKGCIKDMIHDAGYVLKEDYSIDNIIDALLYIDENYIILSRKSREQYKKKYSKENFIYKLNQILGEKDV